MVHGDADRCSHAPPPNRISTTAIQAALVALAPELRVVLELAFFAGLDYQQIAARLHRTPATVTKQMRLGLLALVVHAVDTMPSSTDQPDGDATTRVPRSVPHRWTSPLHAGPACVQPRHRCLTSKDAT